MKHRAIGGIAVTAMMVAVVLLAGGGLLVPPAVYRTTGVSISVAAEGSAGTRAISPTASPENISLITLRVVGEDKWGVHQDPLATATLSYSAGVWSVTLEELPIGPPLTFALEAFDAAGTKIYAGSSTRVLSGEDTILVTLRPYDDGVAIAFPVLVSISRPAEIEVLSRVGVTLGLRGGTDERLQVDFTSGGGSFTPASVSVPLGGTEGELTVDYTAPGLPGGPGGYVHTVRVSNEQGNRVLTEFATVVVYKLGEARIQVGSVAPSVTGLSGQRVGSGVRWTAEVADDGPVEELEYQWSYDGGLAFEDDTANPALLLGYEETATGTVTLVVTDGEGLSTTVSFLLPPGLFPDELVQEPDGDPPVGQMFKLTGSDGAAGDYCGYSVSISGDTALVGAPLDDDLGDRSGSAYVFRWNGESWVQVQKLTASDGAAGDVFGWSVSISGDTALVGAFGDDDLGTDAGSAYVVRLF